jgi:Arc/MetJ-type ribon-helix-helix transcriptional regulator
MSEHSIIKLTVPKGLERKIEEEVRKGEYRTRQELVLELVRNGLEKNEPQAAKLGGSTA